MRRGWFIFYSVLLMLLAGAGGASRAAGSTIELLHGDALRGQGWETLEVHVHVVPTDGEPLAVSVQDARGGLVVRREVPPGNNPFDLVVLLPLPCVAPADLPAGKWPVLLTTIFAGGHQRTDGITIATSQQQRSFRIVTGTDSQADVAGAAATQPAEGLRWDHVAAEPAAVAKVREAEILTAPVLTFAGVDAVLLSPALASRLTPERADALVEAGARLVLASASPPPRSLRSLAWQRVEGTDAWVFPSEPLPRPAILEPALERIGPLNVQVAPAPWVRLAVLGAVPGAIVIVLLARGLFRHTVVVLLVSGLGIGGMTLGMILYLRQNTPVNGTRIGWSVSAAPHVAKQLNSSTVTLTETLLGMTPLFGHAERWSAGELQMLTPVAPDSAAYFSWRGVTLQLGDAGGGSEGVGAGGSIVDAVVPAGETFALLMRECTHTRTIPAFPEDAESRGRLAELPASASGAAGWLEKGYVTPAGKASGGVLLTEWAKQTPYRESLLAWYECQFNSGHRYWIAADVDDPAAASVVDFGPAAALEGGQ